MKDRRLKKGLYVITDHHRLRFPELMEKTESILQRGISALQYRNKLVSTDKKISEATQLKQLCLEYDTTFIINDDIDLARELKADGIHIGEYDKSIIVAREELGKDKIIGVSCYNDMDRADDAIAGGADYVAFGAMFSTTSKAKTRKASAELISKAKQRYEIPVVAIGGITPDNCASLIRAGVDLLAVISSIYLADDPGAVTNQFNRLMTTDEFI